MNTSCTYYNRSFAYTPLAHESLKASVLIQNLDIMFSWVYILALQITNSMSFPKLLFQTYTMTVIIRASQSFHIIFYFIL